MFSMFCAFENLTDMQNMQNHWVKVSVARCRLLAPLYYSRDNYKVLPYSFSLSLYVCVCVYALVWRESVSQPYYSRTELSVSELSELLLQMNLILYL